MIYSVCTLKLTYYNDVLLWFVLVALSNQEEEKKLDQRLEGHSDRTSVESKYGLSRSDLFMRNHTIAHTVAY